MASSKRDLIVQLIRREVLTRYRGSALGVAWSIITPLLMLGIYSFVFGVVFKSRWSSQVSSHLEFSVVMFCGLIVYGIFSETISRAPQLVINNPSYVKKVVFPLEVLPIISLGAALINAFMALVILCVVDLLLVGNIHWTIVFLPLVLLPLTLLSLGCSWFLASLGVYLRDIIQVMPLIVTALMFVTPVFYPLSAVPARFQFLYLLNPLSFVVEQARNVVLWGQFPNWPLLVIHTCGSLLVAGLGFVWFQKTKRGFADVI